LYNKLKVESRNWS